MSGAQTLVDQDLGPSARPSRLIKAAEVCKRVSMSRDTLEKNWKKGKFPEPIVVTSGYYVWLESEVEEFIRDRAKNARAGKLRGLSL